MISETDEEKTTVGALDAGGWDGRGDGVGLADRVRVSEGVDLTGGVLLAGIADSGGVARGLGEAGPGGDAAGVRSARTPPPGAQAARSGTTATATAAVLLVPR